MGPQPDAGTAGPSTDSAVGINEIVGVRLLVENMR